MLLAEDEKLEDLNEVKNNLEVVAEISGDL